MKATFIFFSMLAAFATNTWAESLLPYIELQVDRNNLIAFSSQGIQFKACETCEITKLTPAAGVAYYEHNSPIDIKQATELYVSKTHDFTSVFYDRLTLKYDQVVFGGFIEIEPILQHSDAQ